MKHIDVAESTVSESESTGLPWPKTWKGAYLLVVVSFAFWIVLLIALTEFFA